MVNHQHQHLHMADKRQDMDNKYRFIHIAGKPVEEGNNFWYQNKAEDNQDANVVTIVSQVYVTEPKTFDGPAVYVTKTPVTTQTIAPAETTSHSMNSYESAKSAINQPKTRSQDPYNMPTEVKGTPLSNGEISNQSQGMSGGEKAGLAIGILAIIGLVAGLILFCVRRRKNQMADRGEKLDEKHASQNSFFSGTAAAMGAPAGDRRASVKSYSSTHTAATAPRLSLRPVTQFLPSILENKNTNNGNLSAPSMSEKPRSASPQNPFADSSVEDGDGSIKEVGTAAAVPAPKGQNNVHRVQLDFKPSMDDELGLKSGQLVRMLHEYDDGWALCIRMDRSQQGVCPRTCLSKLPVKPRPQGPAQGRTSPPGVRGPSPQGANKMMPRPLTPNGRERSSTGSAGSPPAAENNRNRSQSASSVDRSVSPINAGMPPRKPAPGQAM